MLFWPLGGNGLGKQPARLLDCADGGVVLRTETAVTFGENVANDPQTVLHVIEGNDAVIKHEHGIVEADFVAQTLGQTLDQTHHVITEIADGTGHQGRQSRQPHGPEALGPFPQKRNGVALFPNDPVAAFEHARAACVTEDFLRMGAGKRVARDFFAAFHAFQEERIPRALRDPQIGADGRQQIRGKHVVHGNEIPLFGQALKFAEVRLDHGVSSQSTV